MPVRETVELRYRMTRLKWLVLVVLTAIVLAQFGPFAATSVFVSAETAMDRTGTISVNTSANIRSGPGTSFSKVCSLTNGYVINITAVLTGEAVSGYSDQWYRINFIYSGATTNGYVLSDLVVLDPPAASETTAESISESSIEVPTTASGETAAETSSSETIAETTVDFEGLLAAEGFPETYKAGLRELHAQYPQWTFKALHTNLKWATVVSNENYKGRSLISGNYNPDGYKSTEDVAYDWATNIWTPYDGSSWVMCNTDVIQYYLDPRNFFNAERFFMFEALNYQPDIQVQAGVEKILSGSFMGAKSFTYTDAASGESRTMLYSEAFMKAAAYSGVSPYHLASRSRMEVGSSGSTSVSGTFSADLVAAWAKKGVTYTPTASDLACDGIYNFYNVAASSSTELLGNIKNGLIYAQKSTALFKLTEFNPTYVEGQTAAAVPWNNRCKSIVAGAMWIGSSYINVGQKTLYLQKFDVDNSDGKLYYHQYMTNILAAWAESKSIYNAYSNMGILGDPMTFIIPVYLEMPETLCALPPTGNPNNWLSTLTVDSYSLTPTFDPETTGTYSLIVDNTVTSVTVAATPVTTKASIAGTGTIQLAVGDNPVSIIVTAENGNTRTYTLNIVRKAGDGSTPPATTPAPEATAAVTPPLSSTTAPTPIATSTSLTIGESTVTGIDPKDGQNTAANVAASLNVPAGSTVSILNADGSACTGLVGTGCIIRVSSGGATVKDYSVVLFGDANGDGKINAIDLTTINWHLLKKKAIAGGFLSASDVNHDEKANAIDLATIVRHILHKLTISQN